MTKINLTESRLKKIISETVRENLNEIMTGGIMMFTKDIVYQDNEWVVVVPSTFESACAWSNGATWDTASRHEGSRYFDFYTQKSPLYIFINKETHDKYQYHKDAGLFDAKDVRVNPQEVGLSDVFDKVVNDNLTESNKRMRKKTSLNEKNSNVKEREYIMKYGEKYTEIYRNIWNAFSMLNEMSNTRLNSHISKLLSQVIQALDKAGEYYNSQKQ